MRHLDPNEGGHPYLQVAGSLRDAIRSGEFPPESQLPSTADLATFFGVSRMTVRNAYRRLTAERLIVQRQGLGVFVHARADDRVNIIAELDTLSRKLAGASSTLAEVASTIAELSARALELQQAIVDQD